MESINLGKIKLEVKHEVHYEEAKMFGDEMGHVWKSRLETVDSIWVESYDKIPKTFSYKGKELITKLVDDGKEKYILLGECFKPTPKSARELIDYINSSNSSIRLRCNESISLPFLASKGDDIFYAVFVYSSTLDFSTLKSTFDLYGIYYINLFDFSDIKEIDINCFNFENSPMLFSSINIHEKIDDFQMYYDETIDLTDKLIELDIFEEEVSLSYSYAEHFNTIVPEELKKYYFSIGKDFFTYIDDIIKKSASKKTTVLNENQKSEAPPFSPSIPVWPPYDPILRKTKIDKNGLTYEVEDGLDNRLYAIIREFLFLRITSSEVEQKILDYEIEFNMAPKLFEILIAPLKLKYEEIFNPAILPIRYYGYKEFFLALVKSIETNKPIENYLNQASSDDDDMIKEKSASEKTENQKSELLLLPQGIPPLPDMPTHKVTIRKTMIDENGRTYEVENEVDIPYPTKK